MFQIHLDVASAVDALLAGGQPGGQVERGRHDGTHDRRLLEGLLLWRKGSGLTFSEVLSLLLILSSFPRHRSVRRQRMAPSRRQPLHRIVQGWSHVTPHRWAWDVVRGRSFYSWYWNTSTTPVQHPKPVYRTTHVQHLMKCPNETP